MAYLKPHHLEDLRSSGLSDETIEQSGFYSATAAQTRDTLGFDVGPGLAIPYPDPLGLQGGTRPFVRVKPDTPPSYMEGAKYVSRRGAGNRLYIPNSVAPRLSADTPLAITEGEKKALKATQDSMDCVAFAGVWCFRTSKGGERGVLPELDKVHWDDREVHIIYDSDAATNDNVLAAESALACELMSRGAVVRVVRLPSVDDKKVGLDDYLISNGADALKDLVRATEPETSRLLRYPDTELGCAERLVNEYGDRIRYCPSTRSWLVWSGARWEVER